MRAGISSLLATLLLSTMFIAAFPAHAEVGIDEKLGNTIPADIAFMDESGSPVNIGSLINGPTIFSLVYLGCRDMCPLLMRGEAELVGQMDGTPGEGYRLVTVSFDENDSPADAARAREIYLGATGKPFPPSEWRFLTGDRENIQRLTDAFGFRFQRTGDGFSHVAALVVVSPKSKIVRYIYGVKFLPFDLMMALAEAQRETVGLSANRALLYCFRYDPEGKRYVFNVLKVTGTVTVFSAIILFAYLVRSSRKRREEMGEDPDE